MQALTVVQRSRVERELRKLQAIHQSLLDSHTAMGLDCCSLHCARCELYYRRGHGRFCFRCSQQLCKYCFFDAKHRH